MKGWILLTTIVLGYVFAYSIGGALWKTWRPVSLDLIELKEPSGFYAVERGTITPRGSAALTLGLEVEPEQVQTFDVCAELYGGRPATDVPRMTYFMDRNCPICREQEEIFEDLGLTPELRPLAIFGNDSLLAALALIAAARQDGVEALKGNLMGSRARVSDTALADLARLSGLDAATLFTDMARPETQAQLTKNQRLAEALGIIGTPALVVEGIVSTGLLDPAELAAIEKAAETYPAACSN